MSYGEICKDCIIDKSCTQICKKANDWYNRYWNETKKLKKCPKCGSIEARIYHYDGCNTPIYAVCCKSCDYGIYFQFEVPVITNFVSSNTYQRYASMRRYDRLFTRIKEIMDLNIRFYSWENQQQLI